MPRKIFIKKKPVKKNCSFCEEDKNPDYKDFGTLRKFTSERGKILGKDITGLCSKHQRRLAREIKRARHLALLPFVEKL